jgi:hypothetical protein
MFRLRPRQAKREAHRSATPADENLRDSITIRALRQALDARAV